MKQINKILLQRYFEGTCTPEEEKQVSDYLQQADLNELHEYIDDADKNAPENISREEIEQSLQAFHQERTKNAPSRIRRLTRVSIAAAAILLIVVTGILFYQQKNAASTQQSQAFASIANNTGHVQMYELEDGTKLWLHPNTSLVYDKATFNENNRAVKLTGEAFFDVAHNTDKPFIVQSGLVTTTVKGTAFNVEAYENEKDVRVVLVRGKVDVSAKTWKYALSPGQMMDYNDEKNNMEIKTVSTGSLSDWTQDKLTFNDLPLEDVLKRLENNYNIRIVCVNPAEIANMRITGRYARKSADEILNKVLFIHGLQYKKQGGQYMIQ